MALYTVHAPKVADGVVTDPAEVVFIKDGFCWPALFIPVVWLIWRRLWLSLLIYLVAVLALSALAGFAGDGASAAVLLLFAFWFALEANGFRRWTLERRGYVLTGVATGRGLEEAERRYFGAAPEEAVRHTPPPAPPHPAASAAAPRHDPPKPPPPRPEPGVVGLFPSPGYPR